MVHNQKTTGRASTIPGGLAAGALVNVLVTVILSAAAAKLVLSGTLAQENIGYGSMFILLITSFLGAMTAQGRVKRRRLLVCMLSGLVYMLLLLSITALFFGGQYTGIAVTALMVFAGTAVAAMASGGVGSRGTKRKHPARRGIR